MLVCDYPDKCKNGFHLVTLLDISVDIQHTLRIQLAMVSSKNSLVFANLYCHKLHHGEKNMSSTSSETNVHAVVKIQKCKKVHFTVL